MKMNNKAHIVVDMLYDFIDGSMACHNSANAVENSILFINSNPGIPVYYITDSHPANHCSFKENGGIWPAHCVKGTHGQKIHEAYYQKVENKSNSPCLINTLLKGEDPAKEQYSGFEAIGNAGETLKDYLLQKEVQTVYVSGIATEYCINETVTDLQKAGFKVILISKALAYVNETGHKETLEKLKDSGIEII